jgi:hypothetical protein
MLDLIPILWTRINSNQPTKEVNTLANSHINKIDKLAFLSVFQVVHHYAFSSTNIQSGSQEAGRA